MTRARFTGTFGLLYPDYVNGATGRALEAAPDGTYDVLRAPGRNPGLSPLPADGRWQAAVAEDGQIAGIAADPGAPQPAARSPRKPKTVPAAPEGEPSPESEG